MAVAEGRAWNSRNPATNPDLSPYRKLEKIHMDGVTEVVEWRPNVAVLNRAQNSAT